MFSTDAPVANNADTKIPVSIRLPKSLDDQVVDYARRRELASKTDAYRDLLEFALVAQSQQAEGANEGHSTLALATAIQSMKEELRLDVEQYSLAGVYAMYQSLASIEVVMKLLAKAVNVTMPEPNALREHIERVGAERCFEFVAGLNSSNADA